MTSTRARIGAGLLSAALATVVALVPAGAAHAAAAPVPDVTVVTSVPTADDDFISDPFSTGAGDELLVAMFSSDGPNEHYGQAVEEVTGCGLDWQELAQANEYPGLAAVYTAYATEPVTDCRVDGLLREYSDGMVAVVSFTGASPQIGDRRPVSGGGSAGFGALSVDVDGSLVYQIGHNWDYAEVPTPLGSDTSWPFHATPASMLGTYLSPLGDTSWMMRLDEPMAATEPGTDHACSIEGLFSSYGIVDTLSFVVQPAG